MKKILTLCIGLFFIGMLKAQLSFTGAGILFSNTLQNNYPVIQQVLFFSPAEDAGLRAGETVWSVDGKSTAGMNIPDVINLIKGNAGTVRTLVAGSDQRSVQITIRLVTGKCTDGDCKEGEGRIEEPNGNIYVGNFSNGKFSGYGTHYFYRGETMTGRLEGYFTNGLANGDGVFNDYQLHIKYTGPFKADKIEGNGKVEFDNTDFYFSGKFSGNKPSGAGIFYFSDGSQKEFTADSWDALLNAAGVTTYSSNEQNNSTENKQEIQRNEEADDTNGSDVDFEPMIDRMKAVENKLYYAIGSYSEFYTVYADAFREGDANSAATAADSKFYAFANYLYEAADLMTGISDVISPDATVSESQYEALKEWNAAINDLFNMYSGCSNDEGPDLSGCYWANVNSDRASELLDKARAARHGF